MTRVLRVIRLLAGLLAALVLLSGLSFAAKPGDLDPSFGNAGKVRIGSTGDQFVFTSVALDSRGRIVAAGNKGNRFALARVRSNGTLDQSFGSGGIAVGGLTGTLADMTIDRYGRIVVAGSTRDGDFLVARYHSDGSPDDSFGTGGAVVTNFGNLDYGSSIAIDSRGRIVAAGERAHKFALARYLPSGSLDPSFSSDGKVLSGFGSSNARATATVIDSRDRVIAAGDFEGYGGFALVRYSRRGVINARSFGVGGKVTTAFGGSEYVNSAAIDSQGRIVVAGTTLQARTPAHFALARYDSSGSLDQTFGGDGRVVSAFGRATDMAIDPHGRVVVVGFTDPPGGEFPDSTLARYLPTGNLDPTFGDDGRVITSGGVSQPWSLAIDSQGRIVTVGTGSFTLARYFGQ